MDLGAYAQIDNLEIIMKENGIECPRLRGLRLMRDEKPLTKEQIAESAKKIGLYGCETACESDFVYDPWTTTLDNATRRLKRKYLVYENPKDTFDPIDIRWNAIHGKKRKLFKYYMKMANRRVEKSYNIFNKYCGRNDILYIHARIGGGNWPYYRDKVENQPWFIEKIDDPFDETYCDIYARIKPLEVEKDDPD